MFRKIKVLVLLFMVFVFSLNVHADSLLPIGGNEHDFNPDVWTEEGTHHSNCYLYAVLKYSSISTDKATMQPGYPNNPITSSNLNEKDIISRVKSDLEQSEKTIYKTTEKKKPTGSYRKIALVIAPGVDYHWYEQNSDGYWSHKQGNATYPTNLDASGNLISNPRTCNRKYTYVFTNIITGNRYKKELNYSNFCGYYMVNN